MRLRAILCGFLFATGPSMAQEPSRYLSTIYRIQAAPAPEGERELASKDWVVKQPLLPDGLAELAEPVIIKPNKPPVPAGTRLLAVKSDAGEVRCLFDARGLTFADMPCLLDADRDGRFESWFGARGAPGPLLMIEGRVPREPTPLPAPVAYRDIDPALHDQQLFVGVQRRNYFNIYGNESFMIVYGSDRAKGEITAPVVVKSADMPKELTVLGARFTAISETKGKMRVRVDAPMPPQPFGVTTTTSYMFIPA